MVNHNSFTQDFYHMCIRGFRQMPAETRAELLKSVTASQGSGGFFRNKAGQEDLYYTFFGLLLALATGAKINSEKCASNLESIDFQTLDLVHGCAWLRSKNILKLIAVPQFLRRTFLSAILRFFGVGNENVHLLQSLSELPSTAFPQHNPQSPYSRFLLGTIYSDYGEVLPQTSLDTYRLPSGLYSNLKNQSQYGVNATAAALFLLSHEKGSETAEALWKIQESDGSFKAVATAPIGDLMSTATAVFAIRRFGKTPRVSVKPYLRDCFRETGFFAATPDDPIGDLEYTVYGLLAMGVIS